MSRDQPHRWQIVGELLVSFTIAGSIPDEVWADFVADIKRKHVTRMLCATLGDVDVTSLQRKLAAEACKSKGLPLAVVAESRIVRGMVTAVSWLGVDIKSFTWEELPEALTHLKVTSVTQRHALEVVRQFRIESS